MKIAVVGNGRVGSALAPRFKNVGHDVVYAVHGDKVGQAPGEDGIAFMGTREACAWAELIVPAINWSAVEGFVAEAGDISGKILVDPVNPLDFANNLAPLLSADTSAAEELARMSGARVVKCFNQVGSPVMEIAGRGERRPLQFVASDDADAKQVVTDLARSIGFDVRDAGALHQSRVLEGMASLWIAQAFGHGMSPTTSWYLMDHAAS